MAPQMTSLRLAYLALHYQMVDLLDEIGDEADGDRRPRFRVTMRIAS